MQVRAGLLEGRPCDTLTLTDASMCHAAPSCGQWGMGKEKEGRSCCPLPQYTYRAAHSCLCNGMGNVWGEMSFSAGITSYPEAQSSVSCIQPHCLQTTLLWWGQGNKQGSIFLCCHKNKTTFNPEIFYLMYPCTGAGCHQFRGRLPVCWHHVALSYWPTSVLQANLKQNLN